MSEESRSQTSFAILKLASPIKEICFRIHHVRCRAIGWKCRARTVDQCAYDYTNDAKAGPESGPSSLFFSFGLHKHNFSKDPTAK